MLVLTRKPAQQIMITTPSGDVIEITLLEVSGDRVRLGFEAEPNIEIHRREIYDKVHGSEAA